jgi:hypothetical protein
MHTAYHRRRAWEVRVMVAAAALLLVLGLGVAALLWQATLLGAGALVAFVAQSFIVRAIWAARP